MRGEEDLEEDPWGWRQVRYRGFGGRSGKNWGGRGESDPFGDGRNKILAY